MHGDAAVRFEPALDMDLPRRPPEYELPIPHRRNVHDHQAVMVAQGLRALRRAVSFEIGRCGAHDAPVDGEPACHQRGIVQIGDADGDVESFLHEIDDIVRQRQLQPDIRQDIQELRHQRHDLMPSERDRRGHTQHAAG